MSKYVNLDGPDVTYYYNLGNHEVYIIGSEAERIDLVRCGECKRFERNGEKEHGNCAYHLALAYLTDYCSWGERREDE